MTPLSIDTREGFQLGRGVIHMYNEPHRVYHTTQHVLKVLEVLDLFEDVDYTTLFAAWYHDCVYFPLSGKGDNERASVVKAEFYIGRYLGQADNSDIRDMILATIDHTGGTAQSDMLIDADLAGFAAPWDEFVEINKRIRQEFSMIVDDTFYPERRKILQEFFDRDTLYRTDLGKDMFEERARNNLGRYLRLS